MGVWSAYSGDGGINTSFIYTNLVGFQGRFIFLTFVVFSEDIVRDEYVKWLKAEIMKSDTLSKYFSMKSTLSTAMVRSLCKVRTLASEIFLSLQVTLPIDSNKYCYENTMKSGKSSKNEKYMTI